MESGDGSRLVLSAGQSSGSADKTNMVNANKKALPCRTLIHSSLPCRTATARADSTSRVSRDCAGDGQLFLDPVREGSPTNRELSSRATPESERFDRRAPPDIGADQFSEPQCRFLQQTLGGSDINSTMVLGSCQDYRFRAPNSSIDAAALCVSTMWMKIESTLIPCR